MNLIYFTDRDLGKRFPTILRNAGLSVERHDDLFAPITTDTEWLKYCGIHHRVAITHNERIRYTPNELAAVVQHKVSLLIVVGRAPLAELAHNFVNTIPRIEALINTHEPPYIAKIYRPSASELAQKPIAQGTALLWYPK